MKRILGSQDGFGLIEALMAVAILAIGILAFYTMQFSAVSVNSTSNLLTRASVDGANQVEEIFASKFNDSSLDDTDGDGTDQDRENNAPDLEGNGEDDDGGDFGLRDRECCQDGNDPFRNAVAGCTERADGCADGGDGYGVYWNVAVDEPMVNTKRVVVYVIRSGIDQGKGVEYEYIVGRDMQGISTP